MLDEILDPFRDDLGTLGVSLGRLWEVPGGPGEVFRHPFGQDGSQRTPETSFRVFWIHFRRVWHPFGYDLGKISIIFWVTLSIILASHLGCTLLVESGDFFMTPSRKNIPNVTDSYTFSLQSLRRRAEAAEAIYDLVLKEYMTSMSHWDTVNLQRTC